MHALGQSIEGTECEKESRERVAWYSAQVATETTEIEYEVWLNSTSQILT